MPGNTVSGSPMKASEMRLGWAGRVVCSVGVVPGPGVAQAVKASSTVNSEEAAQRDVLCISCPSLSEQREGGNPRVAPFLDGGRSGAGPETFSFLTPGLAFDVPGVDV